MAAGAAAAAVKWEYSFFYENPQDLIPALNLSTLQFYSCSENQNSCFSNVWQCAHEGTRLQSWPVKFLRQNYMRTKYVFVDCKILGHLSHMIGYFFVVSCASGQVWWTLNHSGQWISLEVWQVVHMHAAAATYADPKRLQVNFFCPPHPTQKQCYVANSAALSFVLGGPAESQGQERAPGPTGG